MPKFPPISECNIKTKSYKTVAADLDGTLLISNSSFPYFMLIAIEAGSLIRGLILLLTFPIIAISYLLISESLAIKTMIYISFKGLKLRDIEHVSRTVLSRFYAGDVRKESFEVFDKCEGKKVVVTANPIIMVEPFVKDFLGGDVVLGTSIGIDPLTQKATGFVTGDGVLVSGMKRKAIVAEFEGEGMPDVGLGDRKTDHDFMALCKEGYMVHRDKDAKPVPEDRLKSPIITMKDDLLNDQTHSTP
ncbi:glycerol-3-phosphate 2-O-acyltransferase 4-like [Silene latifolia]|uniref:glycerol-3-phosphate 2-O-acyltransferase 4-like n=1 Tax=Silene latifolia TaxID=37657 RepID=UPI003D779767